MSKTEKEQAEEAYTELLRLKELSDRGIDVSKELRELAARISPPKQGAL